MCMIAHVQSNTVDCDVSIMTLTGARRNSCKTCPDNMTHHYATMTCSAAEKPIKAAMIEAHYACRAETHKHIRQALRMRATICNARVVCLTDITKIQTK